MECGAPFKHNRVILLLLVLLGGLLILVLLGRILALLVPNTTGARRRVHRVL